VQDAALVGVPDEKWGEVGRMFVLLKPAQSASTEELLAFCAGRLARYKIPKQIRFVESLPYSPYGKVMKAELKSEK
jgi:fatty-acyl-CoA synthase